MSNFAVVRAVTDNGGKQPDRPTSEVISTRGLDNNFWDLLCKCWSRDPDSRPTINEICAFIHNRSNPSISVLGSDEEELAYPTVEGSVEVADSTSDGLPESVLSLQVKYRPAAGRPVPPLPTNSTRRPSSAPASPVVEGNHSMVFPDRPGLTFTKSDSVIPPHAHGSAIVPPPIHPKRLPSGWNSVKNEKLGRTLYINSALQVTTPIRPELRHSHEFEQLQATKKTGASRHLPQTSPTAISNVLRKVKSFDAKTRASISLLPNDLIALIKLFL